MSRPSRVRAAVMTTEKLNNAIQLALKVALAPSRPLMRGFRDRPLLC